MKFSHYYQRLSQLVFIATSLFITPAFADKPQATTHSAYETVKYVPEYSEAELAQLLAPIALYPDVILSYTLIASTYPEEIAEATHWVAHNKHLTAYQLKHHAKNQYWHESVKALVSFPQILNQLRYDSQWTKQLATAFLYNEEGVLNSVQLLRKKADYSGSLAKLDYLNVERHHGIIVIALPSSNRIRIPYYNTHKVYGKWHWAHHQPVNFHKPKYFSRHRGHFYWSNATYIGAYSLFSTFNWFNHQVVIYKDSKSFKNQQYNNQRRGNNYGYHWKKNRAQYSSNKRKLTHGYNRYAQEGRSYQQRNNYRNNYSNHGYKGFQNKRTWSDTKHINQQRSIKKTTQLNNQHVKKIKYKNKVKGRQQPITHSAAQKFVKNSHFKKNKNSIKQRTHNHRNSRLSKLERKSG